MDDVISIVYDSYLYQQKRSIRINFNTQLRRSLFMLCSHIKIVC